MFANSQMMGVSAGFPDVTTKTTPAPKKEPAPNLQQSYGNDFLQSMMFGGGMGPLMVPPPAPAQETPKGTSILDTILQSIRTPLGP